MQFRSAFRVLLIPTLVGCTMRNYNVDLQAGVSQELAKQRVASIGNLSYSICFTIPNNTKDAVRGREAISFDFRNDVERVILDFTGDKTSIKSLKCNGKEAKYELEQEHIVINSKYFQKKRNQVSVEFMAGDKALNRKGDFMYTLFVPDRARTVFPCFDQPDLKAHFNLELELPLGWTAISNASIVDSTTSPEKRVHLRFEQSDLISTYLFSFTAGKFYKAHKEVDGKKYNILYRENDAKKVAQNLDSIFYMVDYSVRWMERYTGIPYPFSKYDLAIIPYFQFSGMEHPGSVYYVDSKMWLGENATLPEKLARAELIAHETAHLWFGDLVTMKWFDDVWMKEVFAGFFADKVVEKLFPDANSDLQFVLAHVPKAYSEDRTMGANPIRQKLDNLNLAGTMYGNIIYHKAPIAIRSLETLMGKHPFQNALREYLRTYSLGNADWNDLVKIFDKHAKFSVTGWSKSWIESAGMPAYAYDTYYKDGAGCGVIVRQKSPLASKLPYLQLLEFSHFNRGKMTSQTVFLGGTKNAEEILVFPQCKGRNECIVPNSSSFGYGYFELDSARCASIACSYSLMANPVNRASCLISLYENMLNGNFDGRAMLTLLSHAIMKEKNELLVSCILDYLFTSQLYFSSKDDVEIRTIVENSLWKAYSTSADRRLQIQYLRAIAKLMNSDESVGKVFQIWKGEVVKGKSWIQEVDLQNIAFELCVRMPDDASSILSIARKGVKSSDNLGRFDFVSKAVSPDKIVRDKFFESLLHAENRRQEAWVVDALKLLNHPLRSDQSKEYLAEGLAILPEIQQTGDIFFPKSWIASLLYGHTSMDDYLIVNRYINKEGKSISPSLLAKVYQCTDMLGRSIKYCE
jgi:aminopeptidase N